MLTLPSWILFTVEEAIIVLIVLAVFFFLRARKYKKQILQYTNLGKQGFDNQGTASTKILSPPDLKDLGVMKEKLALAEQRVKNLERFRELFFDLKNRVAGLMEHQQHMNEHMLEAGLPLEEQKALIASFEKLKNEKRILEQHLQQVEDELNILMDSPHTSPGILKEAGNAASVIQHQQVKIGKLIQEVADLEVEAATAHRIQTVINQLNHQTDDLTIAIEVLQDENQVLNERVQSLLQQQNQNDQQLASEIDLLTSQLAEKEHDYDELYKRHTTLESEYLKSRS
jgi:hypothetical protein